MSECENCGIMTADCDRFCFNCHWDKQPERGLLDEPFTQYPKIKEVTKETLERFIWHIDCVIDRITKDEYKTKKHLYDEYRNICSYYAESHDLETGIKYYENHVKKG